MMNPHLKIEMWGTLHPHPATGARLYVLTNWLLITPPAPSPLGEISCKAIVLLRSTVKSSFWLP